MTCILFFNYKHIFSGNTRVVNINFINNLWNSYLFAIEINFKTFSYWVTIKIDLKDQKLKIHSSIILLIID